MRIQFENDRETLRLKKEKEAVDKDRFKKLMDYSLNTDFKVLDGMMAGLQMSKDGKQSKNLKGL